MAIKKTKLTGAWGLKLPALILLGYFCVLFPTVNIIFREARWAGEILYPAYYALALLLITGFKKSGPGEMGFSRENLRQNILIGGISGAALLLSLPALDGFIDISGLGNNDLFAGAELRAGAIAGEDINFAYMAASTLLLPILEQAFFSGFILQALLRKIKPIAAIYLGAIIFSAAHFNFQLGGFAVGLITATFYYRTGTLYAGIIFQMLCGIGGVLIQYTYPRLITLLAFLY